MLSLLAYQIQFIQSLRTKLEEAFKNGSGDTSLEVLPIYKYRDPLFDESTLPALDPTYYPYDTQNPTRRESTRLSFLNLISALLSAFSDYEISFVEIEPATNLTKWNNTSFPNLKVGKEIDGKNFLIGGIKATAAISSGGLIGVTPFKPKFAFYFNGVKNTSNAVFKMDLNGNITIESTTLTTNDVVFLNINFR